MLGHLYQWLKVPLARNALGDIHMNDLGTDHRGNTDAHAPTTARQWPLSPLEKETE